MLAGSLTSSRAGNPSGKGPDALMPSGFGEIHILQAGQRVAQPFVRGG